MAHIVNLPKPEVRGVGHVWYRCAECAELMEPEDAVVAPGTAIFVAGNIATLSKFAGSITWAEVSRI